MYHCNYIEKPRENQYHKAVNRHFAAILFHRYNIEIWGNAIMQTELEKRDI